MGSMAALPGGAEDYMRDSIESSLGLPVSDRSLCLKLLASEDRRRLLQDHIFSLEEDLRAAARRIDLLKEEGIAAMVGMIELEILGMNFGCVLSALADAKIPDKGCLIPLASKLLGYCIVAASTTVKLPQILKILKHGSVRGLCVASFELEHKRKSSSLKETSPVSRAIDFNSADSSRHPVSPLPPNSPDYRVHKK